MLTGAAPTETSSLHTTQPTINILGWVEYSKLATKHNTLHQKWTIFWEGVRQSFPLLALGKSGRQAHNHQTSIQAVDVII